MKKLFNYLREARQELRKVTWPTRKQTINYSILVIAISLGVALYIGVVDYVLNLGVEAVLTEAPTTAPATGGAVGNPVEVTPDFNSDAPIFDENSIQVETQPIDSDN